MNSETYVIRAMELVVNDDDDDDDDNNNNKIIITNSMAYGTQRFNAAH